MTKIKHIALTTQDPDKTAAFYKEAFGLKEIRRSPNGAVFLTDGYINLAILNWKTEKDADVGPNGPNYNGIHHFGFEVDDLAEASEKIEQVQGQRLYPEGRTRHRHGPTRPTQRRDEVGWPRRGGARRLPDWMGHWVAL